VLRFTRKRILEVLRVWTFHPNIVVHQKVLLVLLPDSCDCVAHWKRNSGSTWEQSRCARAGHHLLFHFYWLLTYKNIPPPHTHTHTHAHTYSLYICVCVCQCWFTSLYWPNISKQTNHLLLFSKHLKLAYIRFTLIFPL